MEKRQNYGIRGPTNRVIRIISFTALTILGFAKTQLVIMHVQAS